MEQGGGPRQDRGLLEIFENRIVKKVPQTSVAPTYKLTLPSEFVVANLSHLVDQSFELTNKEGSAAWKVALLPRRNKNKFEYTLQGWKAFALAHGVNTGDRLQMELLPDGQRMRAHIVRRAVLRDRVPSDPGPASPTLMDVACAAKRSLGADGASPSSSGQGGNEDGNDSDSPMRSSRQTDASHRQNSASWSSGPSSADRQLRSRFQEPARRGLSRRKSSGGAHAPGLQGSAGQQLGSPPPKLEREGSAFRAAALQPQDAQLEAMHLTEPAAARGLMSPNLAVATPRQHEHAAADAADEHPEEAHTEQDWDAHSQPRSAFARKAKLPDSPAASPLHRKRVRSGLTMPLNGISGDGSAQRPFPEPAAAPAAAMPDCDQARSRGMQLLFCAADELDNNTRRAGGAAAAPATAPNSLKRTVSEGLQVDAPPANGSSGRDESGLPQRMAQVLEAQTSRGLIVVSALLKLADRMASPQLLSGAGAAAAAELRGMHAELKQHTNEVLDAMWHVRNLERQPLG